MPPRLTAQDFDQDLLILFDAYVHGHLDRRGFLGQAQKFAKAGVTAAGLLAALSPDFAAGQQVPPSDPKLRTERVDHPSPAGSGTARGYLARPAAAGATRLPAVLVIHENRGLNPHIEDIARRLALDGFMAFAPDAPSPLGGYPGDEDKARDALRPSWTRPMRGRISRPPPAGSRRARMPPGSSARSSFCYGGGIVHVLSYAHARPERRRAALWQRAGAGRSRQGQGAAARASGRRRRAHQCGMAGLRSGAQGRRRQRQRLPVIRALQHGFNNDTTPRYDAAAAKPAWARTIEFLKLQLGGAAG